MQLVTQNAWCVLYATLAWSITLVDYIDIAIEENLVCALGSSQGVFGV